MIISDSSTLILLAKCELIELFVSGFSLIIPETVYDETIRKGMEIGKYDAYLLEKLVYDEKIQVKQTNNESLRKIQDFFSIHSGESDAIALCLDLNVKYLLCDDKKAINACRILGIKFLTALDILLAMHTNNLISNEKANVSLDRLEEFGWYNKELINRIRSEING